MKAARMVIRGRRTGFTLVELMIVVAVIGVLAAIAIPSFKKARARSRIVAIANDLRVFSGAFESYAMEQRGMPGETEGPHFLPPGMGINAFLDKSKFVTAGCIEGGYDWDGPDPHPYFGISLRPWQVTDEIVERLDKMMDNDDVLTGAMRWMYGGSRYASILQE